MFINFQSLVDQKKNLFKVFNLWPTVNCDLSGKTTTYTLNFYHI